jgi:hypothetical protein
MRQQERALGDGMARREHGERLVEGHVKPAAGSCEVVIVHGVALAS